MTNRTEAMDNLIAQDADLIDVTSKVTEADREVLIRISNSDDETAQRIRRGLIYTWEVGEISRHRQYAYDQGYYDGGTNPIVRHDALRDALADLLHAVCGKTGFAEAVRRDSGRIYPWPALDLAEAKALEALEQNK